MAVTTADLAVALRLSADGTGIPMAQESILARLMGVAEAHIMLLAPDAPEAIQDEATIRLAAYLYDVPNAGRRDSFSNSYVNSGAGSFVDLTGLLGPLLTARAALQAGPAVAFPSSRLKS